MLAGALLACALALALATAPRASASHAAGARARTQGCKVRRSRTVASTPVVRIYWIRFRRRTELHGRGSGFRYYACWKATGKRTRLGEWDYDEYAWFQGVRFGAGDRHSRFVGLWFTTLDNLGPDPKHGVDILSVDVKAGRILHRNPPRSGTDQEVRGVVEAARGSFAYVGTGRGGAGCFGVHALGPGRRERDLHCLPLDGCGYDYEHPRRCSNYGLRYGGGRVHWTVGGVDHSAALA
jgi:hypothetical protein